MFKRIIRSVGYARLVAFLLIAFAIWVRQVDPIPLQIVRNLTFDFYQRVLPRAPEPLPVAIIDVDDASLAEIGQWPWPRTEFATLIDKLAAAGAVAVAFDIVFAEADRLSPSAIVAGNRSLPPSAASALRALPDNEDVMAQSFAKIPVILGQTNVRLGSYAPRSDAPIPDVTFGMRGPDPEKWILTFPELVENLPVLEAAAAGRGMFSIRPDADGIYRNTPVVMVAEGKIRLSLAAELLRIATGGAPFLMETNEAGVNRVRIAGQYFQTAGDGSVRPYLTRTQADRFISAADVLQDRVDPAQLRGKLLFVGTSAVGLQDVRATPFGVRVPGVELHAQLLENLITGVTLQRPNTMIAIEMAVALALCLLIVVLTPIMSASILVISSTLMLITCGWVSFALFQSQRLLLDPSFPILAGLGTIIFMSTTNYLREESRRREIRSAFGQYVSADLVDTLAENPENLRLGGETRNLTLLFSDVRGFTSIAEGFREDPAGLTSLMNRLLSTLSDAILAERGTIDKFMGDAVMAFWNAPLKHEDHARAACRAALVMRANIDALNTKRRAELDDAHYKELRIGIGIATGSCLVGNMGSDLRFDYTAMGDPVNLASRLEGQSSFYGQTIVIAAQTEQMVRRDFAILELDQVRVKGKSQKEHIFVLVGDSAVRGDADFKALRDENAKMLASYRAQDWEAARAALDTLRPLGAQFDAKLANHFDIYAARIAGFQNTPPPPDWDGVWDATSK